MKQINELRDNQETLNTKVANLKDKIKQVNNSIIKMKK
jgi:uncharacterized protein YfkK (UPF0435 family)